MDKAGVSFYLGFPGDRTPVFEHLEMAAGLGVRLFFTSVQIPETDIPSVVPELRRIGRWAQSHGYRVLADVAPAAFARLGGSAYDLSPFADLGLSVLRIDAGFDPEAIRQIAANPFGIEVMLNASAVTPEMAEHYQRSGLPLAGRLASHNYYPRRDSGLSLRWAADTSAVLHDHGALVGAFVASRASHRPPIGEGLPTLERHRDLPVGRAAMELFARGIADMVFIGDPATDPQEIADLLAIAADPHLRLRVALEPTAGPEVRAIAFGRVHATSAGDFECVFRARGDRQREGLRPIPPGVALPRPAATVTIDNDQYQRYAGELQITRGDLPADPRVNVVGRIVPDDRPLLDLLGPRTPFELVAI